MQSVKQQAMPLIITNKDNGLAGSLQKYVNAHLIDKEKVIFDFADCVIIANNKEISSAYL